MRARARARVRLAQLEIGARASRLLARNRRPSTVVLADQPLDASRELFFVDRTIFEFD